MYHLANTPPQPTTWDRAVTLLRPAVVALGAYHGYKRSGSIGGAVLWAVAGGLAPVIALPVALAQGLGKPK